MVVGGSELPRGLAKQALALGADVYAGYGMSESAPLLCLAQSSPQISQAVPGKRSISEPKLALLPRSSISGGRLEVERTAA